MAMSNEFTTMSVEELQKKQPSLRRLTLILSGIFAIMAGIGVLGLVTGRPTLGILMWVLALTMLPMLFAQIGAGRRLSAELAKR